MRAEQRRALGTGEPWVDTPRPAGVSGPGGIEGVFGHRVGVAVWVGGKQQSVGYAECHAPGAHVGLSLGRLAPAGARLVLAAFQDG